MKIILVDAEVMIIMWLCDYGGDDGDDEIFDDYDDVINFNKSWWWWFDYNRDDVDDDNFYEYNHVVIDFNKDDNYVLC